MQLNWSDLWIDVPGVSKLMWGQVVFAIGFGALLGILFMREWGFDLAHNVFFVVGTAGLFMRIYGTNEVEKNMKEREHDEAPEDEL